MAVILPEGEFANLLFDDDAFLVAKVRVERNDYLVCWMDFVRRPGGC